MTTQPMKMVIYPPVDEQRLERIQREAGEMMVVNAATDSEAQSAMQGADAFFGKLTKPLLDAAGPSLKWVQSPTASLEHYVFPELVSHSCELTNMRGLFSDVIADHVLGYILIFARNFHHYLRQQSQRRWEPVGGESARSSFTAGPGIVSEMDRAHLHLSDCCLGIVGLGHIGLEIARRAGAFGMRVQAVDPRATQPPAEVEWLGGTEQLGEMLGRSDFVVIAAPHTPDTEGLFDAARIAQLKPTAYLINIGRGVIVKLDALVDALQSGALAGAALDVFETEPLPADHPLWTMDNVIITPHVAACSVHIAQRHLDVLLDNIGRFRRGETLRNVASKTMWF